MGLGSASPLLMQVFKKTGGVVWKRHAMNHTRRANAKERHRRIQQVEEVLRVCSKPPVGEKFVDKPKNSTEPSKAS